MERRSFLKLTGIAGILAAHRAPAFAQGTKLHIVRWVDFIPEADVELKRQAPEASKALGAEVHVRVHQRQRPAAAHHGRHPVGQRRRHHPDAVELAAPLRQRAWSTSPTWPSPSARRRAALRRLRRRAPKVGGRGGWPSRTASAATPSPTGGRGSTRSALKEFPKTWDEWREAGKKLKAKGKPVGPGARPQLRRPADLRLSAAVGLRRRRGRHRAARRSSINSKGTLESVEVHAGVLEGRLRRGRAGLGRHQQQPAPSTPARSSPTLQRRLDLHRRQAPEGQDQGRQGRAARARTSSTRRSCRRDRPGSSRSTAPSSTRS